MPVNSRAKGKRGELEAVKYLKSLGFSDARRTQQYNGLGRGDVECPESLPCLHIEVKFGYPIETFDLGTEQLFKACRQAVDDAKGDAWAVLWKPKGRRQWRLTTYDLSYNAYVTICDDFAIEKAVRAIND